jgi:hypothetical protein
MSRYLVLTKIYFDRKNVRFIRLFTREGDLEHSGCGNTEHRGPKVEYCPDCHLAHINLRKGTTYSTPTHVIYVHVVSGAIQL